MINNSISLSSTGALADKHRAVCGYDMEIVDAGSAMKNMQMWMESNSLP